LWVSGSPATRRPSCSSAIGFHIVDDLGGLPVDVVAFQMLAPEIDPRRLRELRVARHDVELGVVEE
jgi:hypothetical protein